MQRLGLLLAAVASLSGPQACQTFAGQCVGMISGGEGGQYHVSGSGEGCTATSGAVQPKAPDAVASHFCSTVL